MACRTCHQLEEIPKCSDSIALGSMTIDTDIYIYVKNLYSGYIHKQEAISSGAGLVTLDLTKPSKDFYNKDSASEIWVTLRTDNDKIDFTINAVSLDCFNLSVYPVNDFSELP